MVFSVVTKKDDFSIVITMEELLCQCGVFWLMTLTAHDLLRELREYILL
jgi:hypothetical protein